MGIENLYEVNPPFRVESGMEGRMGGRALLFLWAGCEFPVVVATRGSNSHGETLSGRKMADGSSH